MGNSGSAHHSHTYKSSPSQTQQQQQQQQQFVQSLPREGRGRGSSTTAAQKYYNGGFKVLPERVPGQKLRLTDNGNLLQNGGTLSGRRLIGNESVVTDQEFARLLKRRSDIAHHESSRTDDEYEAGPHSRNHRFERDGTLNKKYHSNPDLLHSHGIVSGNPSGVPKGKKGQKKTKAPSPPRHQYSEDEVDGYVHSGGGNSASKDKKRPFANFLRTSPKKSNDGGGKHKLSLLPKHDVDDFNERVDDMPIPYSMPPTDINAEVTAAKMDSRDKSVTYVLERREMHSSSSVLNISKSQNHVPLIYKNGPITSDNPNPDNWHFNRGQSPDAYKSPQPPIHDHSPPNRHPQLQANLSDGSLQARSIDRTDLRNRAFELQKRVRSMDSLADNSDDRGMHLNRRNSPSPKPLRESPSRELLESLGVNAHSRGVPVTRKPSYGSSLQTDTTGERQSPLNNVNKQMGGILPSPMQLFQDNGPIPAARSRLLQRSDSNNRKTFYYGGEPEGDRQFVGSLDRRGLGSKKNLQQRDILGAEVPGSEREHPRMPRENQRRQQYDQQDDEMTKIKDFNFDDDHRLNFTPKDKQQKQAVPKQMVTQEMRDNDNSATKIGKTYRDKNISSHGFQGMLFDDGRERAADMIKRRQKSGPGHGLMEDIEPDTGEQSSEDEMDINMQLRPMLPKRPPIMPRFSPTHVWRSFTLDDEAGAISNDRASDHSSDPEDADVFEERILRIARPIAPPRGSNEKSADSGISPGAVSPDPPMYDFDAVVVVPEKASKASRPTVRKPFQYLPTSPPRPISPLTAKEGIGHLPGASNITGSRTAYHHHHESPMVDKRRQWTPEEDLASDFDAGSADHVAPEPMWKSLGPEMVSTQPKFTTRKDMFSSGRPEINNKSESPEISEEPIKPSKKYKGSKAGDNANSSQTYNSVRKLKRSLSGVLQSQVRTKTGDEERHTNLDDNWSLSRSLPNSLHNGHDGEKMSSGQIKDIRSANSGLARQPRLPRSESGPIFMSNKLVEQGERQSFSDLEGLTYSTERNILGSPGMRYNRNGHIMYLPKYEAMEIISENKERYNDERKAYSDLGMSTKPTSLTNDGRNFPLRKPKKFTYQSTVRQLERKQLEEKLSQEVAVKEHQRAREMDLVNRVEEEFQKKRDKEKADIRNQLRILSMESLHDDSHTSHHHHNNTRSLPREYPVYDDSGDNPGVHLRENSITDKNEWNHLSLPPMIIPPEDYDMTLPKDFKSKAENRSPKRNSTDNRTKTQLTILSNSGKNTNIGGASPMGSSGFFGGIGKWMRRQQRLEKHNDHSPPRQEPEGAPSSLGLSGLHLDIGSTSPATRNIPFQAQQNSPHQQNRSFAISGAKFSSGRSPDDHQPHAKPVSPNNPHPKKSIYTHLAEVVVKEENRQKGRSPVGARDAKTSIWITQDRPQIHSKSATNISSNNTEFYDIPFNNLDREVERGKLDSSNVDNASSQHTRSTRDTYDRHFEPHNSLREWNVGQRHSIAVDTSREQWATGIVPPPQGYEDTKRRNMNITSSNNRLSPHSSSMLDGPPSWNQGLAHRDSSYLESVEGGSSYKQRYLAEPPSLNPHQRSLSFNHIWDGSASNSHKQDNTSSIEGVSPVQPFSSSKAYRPVAFQGGRHGLSK